ncbi:unnamed protein product [Mytilus coruscus]|uniref:HAT C-terminal dimerisation domain-containing protein n=1 Tax=Mytilus coruscus TaxID=42192 RepID=A0A6J8CWG0_MYTCO|nr:unnamed protein product [Mytilus coruscus]
MDPETLLIQWQDFIALVSSAELTDRSLPSLLELFHSPCNKDKNLLFMYPLVAKLFSVAIIQPLSTAEVERIFSQVKLIKTSHRANLKTQTLTVKLNCDETKFEKNFDQCVTTFFKKKNRRLVNVHINPSHSHEKYKQENNAVKELINDKGDVISDTDGILDIEYSFYKNLYSCVKVDNVKVDEFISSVDVKINQNEKEMCDAEISYDEITEALMAMSKIKSPGTDGFTTEFYCKFYDCLRNILCYVYNSIYDENILSRSMRAGV